MLESRFRTWSWDEDLRETGRKEAQSNQEEHLEDYELTSEVFRAIATEKAKLLLR